jgi:hypothetical protein
MKYSAPQLILKGRPIANIQGQPNMWRVIYKHGGFADTNGQLIGMFFIATPSAYEADE